MHTDGFQASRTTQKDCYVIEIKVLNAGKHSTIDILPVLFIPLSSKKLIRTVENVFATFLQPLVAELESLFLNGFETYYNYPLNKIFDGNADFTQNCVLRAILMMVTGDHPAQCKIGSFKDGGQSFCRRDKARATFDNREGGSIGRYLYDGNRHQSRYPPSKRTIDEMTNALLAVKRICNQHEREETLKAAGLSGKSILWRLYDMYGFNLSTDLVYNAMHILSLNLFRKYISRLMKECTNEVKKEIDSIVENTWKITPTSISYGRWPRLPSKHHGGFKAEENQKFIQWCLPSILLSVTGLSEKSIELGLLMIDIAHIFYNYCRTNGWSKDAMDITRQLFLAWRVRSEEYYGANSSPLEHVAGMFSTILFFLYS